MSGISSNRESSISYLVGAGGSGNAAFIMSPIDNRKLRTGESLSSNIMSSSSLQLATNLYLHLKY